MGRDEDEGREGRGDIGIGKGVRVGMTRMEGGWGQRGGMNLRVGRKGDRNGGDRDGDENREG